MIASTVVIFTQFEVGPQCCGLSGHRPEVTLAHLVENELAVPDVLLVFRHNEKRLGDCLFNCAGFSMTNGLFVKLQASAN